VRLDVDVSVFFAIAGFLLFRPYLAAYVDGIGAPSCARYLFRRALRILPGYWVALTVLTLAGLVDLGSPGVGTILAGAGLRQPCAVLRDCRRVEPGRRSVLYLALPALVALLMSERTKTRTARLRNAGLMVTGLWGWSEGFNLWLKEIQGSHSSIWFNALPGTLDWFAIGMGLAV
jgi:hypothetical protein